MHYFILSPKFFAPTAKGGVTFSKSDRYAVFYFSLACLTLRSSLACFIGRLVAQGDELRDNRDAEPDVVVRVVGIVVVAIRGAAILSVVVPVAAAKHAVGAFWPASIRSVIARRSARASLPRLSGRLVSSRQDELRDKRYPETDVVERVVGIVAVAIRGAAEPSEVDPEAAAKHAVGASSANRVGYCP